MKEKRQRIAVEINDELVNKWKKLLSKKRISMKNIIQHYIKESIKFMESEKSINEEKLKEHISKLETKYGCPTCAQYQIDRAILDDAERSIYKSNQKLKKINKSLRVGVNELIQITCDTRRTVRDAFAKMPGGSMLREKIKEFKEES
jgi:cob(I)alamin adenosyltransferase